MKYVINGKQNHWVTDYFARVQFQNRGSPIFICSFGLRVMDRILVEKNIHYINSTICTSIPSRESDPEMNNLVQRLQTHSHIAYCCRGHKSSCQFQKKVCDKTKVFGNVDFSHSHKKKGMFWEKKEIQMNV